MTYWVFQGGNGNRFDADSWLSTNSPPQTGLTGEGDIAENES